MADAFIPSPTIVPSQIEDIAVILVDFFGLDAEGNPKTDQVRYEVQIRYNDGQVRVASGNLIPHLTPAQISSLQTFMASMRTKAEAELL